MAKLEAPPGWVSDILPMAKARGFPFNGTATAARTSTTALGDAEPIFGCVEGAGMVYGSGAWNGVLGVRREQLWRR